MKNGKRWCYIGLGLILALSLGVRVALVLREGQFFWYDEGRYEAARRAVRDCAAGEYREAVGWLGRNAAHQGFKILGLIPASIEHTCGRDGRIPGMFFALFAVVNLWLLYRVARAAEASRTESLLAVFLLACSAAMTYFSAHVLSYDASLTAGLLLLWAVVAGRGYRFRHSLLCGLLACMTFLVYNGYWAFGGACLLIHVFSRPRDTHSCVMRAAVAGLGLLVPLGGLFCLSIAMNGELLDAYVEFAATVDQGDFSEGWSFPFEYLWYAEHGLLLLWLVALVTAVCSIRNRAIRERTWLFGLALLYALFVLCSNVIPVFVLYGRTVRQLVPFLGLVAAALLVRLGQDRRGRVVLVVLCLGAGIQSVFNLLTPLTQVYPEPFRRSASEAARKDGREAVVFARQIWPEPQALDLPPHDVVLSESHPQEFKPWQYEGYTPKARQKFREQDVRMKLIRVAPEDVEKLPESWYVEMLIR